MQNVKILMNYSGCHSRYMNENLHESFVQLCVNFACECIQTH